MKSVIAVISAVALAGCASTGGSHGGPDQFLGGEAGDLRVLVNDMCPQGQPSFSAKSLGDRGIGSVAQQILAGLGGVAFQSFGTFLKKAGQPDVTRSVGSNGGFFYTVPTAAETVSLSPSMRCVYLVRNGFASKQTSFASEAPADLKDTWRNLGLTRTPDFFAVLHIETATEADRNAGAASVRDRPEFDGLFEGAAPARSGGQAPFFRIVLDRLYVREFQNPSASGGSRDLALIFNYGLASSQAAIATTGPAAGVTDLTGKFAVGGVRLAGAHAGDYGPQQLVSLQTGWMSMPPSRPIDPRATVDISAYVVEFAPGNPLLEEIGSYLASDDVASSVTGALQPSNASR
jgi:hypothetical protein